MQYPEFFRNHGNLTFMQLPQAYQEFLIRWYYYDNTEETKIPATIPIENIEAYILEHFQPSFSWMAKGFVAARNVDAGDNLDFKNDSDFSQFCWYIAKVYYEACRQNGEFNKPVSKSEFKQNCYLLTDIPY